MRPFTLFPPMARPMAPFWHDNPGPTDRHRRPKWPRRRFLKAILPRPFHFAMADLIRYGFEGILRGEDVLTSSQIRDARHLLGWSRDELSRASILKLDVIDQAEGRDGIALLTYGQEIAIRKACNRAGVVFEDHPPAAQQAKRHEG